MARRKRPTLDRALSIETSRKVRISVAPGDGPLARYARDYEPTPPEVFEELMTEVRMPLSECSFVDLGAGKGRVLCLAANRPFRQVVGVELFEALANKQKRTWPHFPLRGSRRAQSIAWSEMPEPSSPPPGRRFSSCSIPSDHRCSSARWISSSASGATRSGHRFTSCIMNRFTGDGSTIAPGSLAGPRAPTGRSGSPPKLLESRLWVSPGRP